MENEQQAEPQIEIPSKPQIVEDLSTPYIEILGKESVCINSKILGVDKWSQMLEETEKDGAERSIVISKRKGEIYTSDIFTGLSEKQNRGNNAETFTPLFPHGLKSLLPDMKDISSVHSHPTPKKLDHIQTTIFTDKDIINFMNCDDRASVLIDRGGAHILVRTGKTYDSQEFVKAEIVKKVLEKISDEGGKILDAIKLVSKELSHYGIAYLYTPNLTPDPKGYVEFFDPNKIKEKQNFTAL